MHFHIQFLIWHLFCLFTALETYKILVASPSVSRSHLISNARVADALARDGHNVTLLEIEYTVSLGLLNASKVARVQRIHGHFLSFKMEDGTEMDLHKLVVKMAFQKASFFDALKKHLFFSQFMKYFFEACEKLITTRKDHLERLKAEKFDLIIGEQFDFCSAGLAHFLDIPTYVLLSSCPINENTASIFGLPTPSSWVPSMEADTSDKMSFYERFKNVVRQTAASLIVGQSSVEPLNAIFRKHFGADYPDIIKTVKNSPLIFVNVDELLDFPRPIFSNIIYIGGLEIEEQNRENELAVELTVSGIICNFQEPYKSEMEKGSNGVILFSLGSIIRGNDLPEEFRRNIFQAFAHFPDYHFIVRADKEDNFSMQIAARMDNVFLASWLPQTQLLKHPRLRLFIGHGGYNSLMETARAGVPLIAMGFFADQYRNARMAERNGWALAFDKLTLLEGSEVLREAIQKVLTDPKYKTNAKRIQHLIRTKPFSAEERLQKSIRFLEQSGGKLPELLPESRNLSTMELYNLDVLLVALLVWIILLCSVLFVSKWILRSLLKKLINEKRKAE